MWAFVAALIFLFLLFWDAGVWAPGPRLCGGGRGSVDLPLWVPLRHPPRGAHHCHPQSCLRTFRLLYSRAQSAKQISHYWHPFSFFPPAIPRDPGFFPRKSTAYFWSHPFKNHNGEWMFTSDCAPVWFILCAKFVARFVWVVLNLPVFETNLISSFRLFLSPSLLTCVLVTLRPNQSIFEAFYGLWLRPRNSFLFPPAKHYTN